MLDANPTKRYRGAVKEIGRRVNRSKATVPVKIEFVDRAAITTKDVGSKAAGARAAGTRDAGTDNGKDNANDDARVLPDMAARVSFLAAELDAKTLDVPPKLVVPVNAIAQRNGVDVVFVVDEGELRMTAVTLGAAVRATVASWSPRSPRAPRWSSIRRAISTDGQKVKENKR